jgi:uncharacterized protein (DUF58 family)
MMGRLFSRGSQTETSARAFGGHIKLDAQNDGLLYVTPHLLITLRHAAESLPLRVAKVRALQSGEYYSPFKGRGMEFDEVRQYQPGDDIRTLDWRVTARTGTAHTKLFREERERAALLWVDYRQAMFFATRGAFKSVVASKAAALLAWSAAHQGDRLGALLFSEDQHKEQRPQRSKIAVTRLLQALAQQSTRVTQIKDQPETRREVQEDAMQNALGRLRRVSKPGSLLILISDFRYMNEQAEAHLYQLARQNDVVLIFIYDPIEAELPPAGYYRVSDSQNTYAIDTGNKQFRREYHQRYQAHWERLYKISRRHHIHFVGLSTADDLLKQLQKGFGILSHGTRFQ